MICNLRMIQFASSAMAACALLSGAPASAQGVKIGVLNDQSGTFADYGGKGSVEAAKMAIEDFGGSVLGEKIELVSADHQNKPDLASAIARRWYDAEGVDMITDLTTSSVALAVQGIAAEKKKIDIVVGAATSAISGSACTPYGFHWAFDTHALAVSTGGALVKTGGDTWYFVTVDYAFGHALEKDTSAVIEADGGKVLGHVLYPLNAPDFSSFLLQAQSSKAKIVGLANAGADMITAVKQANEFGLTKSGQKLAVLLGYISDIESLGLPVAKGLVLTEPFYWDRTDESRAWSKRFFDKFQRMPTAAQAGVYSATMHYLEAVKQAGVTDSAAVMKIMKDTPVNDFFARGGVIREDGRMVHDMYLFQVKSPEESKGKYDDYKLVATIPGKDAFLPLSESKCPLVKK